MTTTSRLGVESHPHVDSVLVQAFANSLRGHLVHPDDPGYDDARSIYNAMIDKHPAMIAQCVDVADVMTSVHFARDNSLLLAIRGGGHNGPGLGSCDGGIVVDLGLMKSVRVDPLNNTVRVEGGCTWAMSIMPRTPSASRFRMD